MTTIDLLKYKIIGDRLNTDKEKAKAIAGQRGLAKAGNSGAQSPSISSPLRGGNSLDRFESGDGKNKGRVLGNQANKTGGKGRADENPGDDSKIASIAKIFGATILKKLFLNRNLKMSSLLTRQVKKAKTIFHVSFQI